MYYAKHDQFVEKVREAVADYMISEGCGCCRDHKEHEINATRLAALLGVPPYEDGSGFNFTQFCSEKNARFRK